MVKTCEEIDAEKAAQPRPDLIPGEARLAIGAVMAYGLTRKHGAATYRVAGTEQADPATHIASAERHLAKAQGNPHAVDAESGLMHIAHAASQLAIALACMAAQQEKPVEDEDEWRTLKAADLPEGTVVVDTVGNFAIVKGAEFMRPDVDADTGASEWYDAKIAKATPHRDVPAGTRYLYVGVDGRLVVTVRPAAGEGDETPCYIVEGSK